MRGSTRENGRPSISWLSKRLSLSCGHAAPRPIDVLNRSNAGDDVFSTHDKGASFEAVLEEPVRREPLRILCYSVMLNHWQLAAWPQRV